ncbi:uncharacterized protein LOC134252133 [Saccostrea cucullata]|uniref:uncharacterized protein LOC134252133 n=1 Tax=Saccostrea cuccullata TaxID=36930 RepID=UPI002ED497BF
METTLQNANEVLRMVTGGKASPLRAQLRTDISSAGESTIRYYKRKAEESVDSVLNLIAPGQSSNLKQLITESTKEPSEDDLINTILRIYEETTNNQLCNQILSVVSKKLTKDEIMQRLPGITKYKIDQARLTSTSITALDMKDRERRPREKMDEEKMQHAINFFFDPCFTQIVSYGTRELEFDTGEKIRIPDVIRTVCHAQIVQMYLAFCKENEFKPLGKSSLFKILKACAASKRKNLHGLDNTAADGVEAFQSLHTFLNTLKNHSLMSAELHKELTTALTSSRIYLKTDYKLHIQESDLCADHCINWSLSDSNNEDFQNPCDHFHSLKCDRCELLKDVCTELHKIVNKMDNGIDKDEYTNIISEAMKKILRWKSHIIRTVNQDRYRTDVIDHLDKNQCVLVMDWAMKFVPQRYREKQTDWFGQRGRNWHVIVCIYTAEDGSISHRTFTHVFDGVKQDWFCVASLLEDAICAIKDQLPHIQNISLRSDNAGCYHCGLLWLCLPEISKKTGIHIKEYCFSEAQAGKSFCDSKIAHMRTKMKTWVASGNNIVTASDMKTALDSGKGVAGCQIAVCVIDTSKQTMKTHKLKGVNDYSYVGFQRDGIILKKAYNIGKGQFISYETLDKLAYGKQKYHESGCTIISGFSLPLRLTGKIEGRQKSMNQELFSETTNIQEAVNNSPNCIVKEEEHVDSFPTTFHCTVEGCVRKFATFKGLENHLLIGKHSLQLQKETTFDKIKHQWVKLCNELVFSSKVKTVSFECSSNDLQVNTMGWGLKENKTISRFPESVKNFLVRKFEEGKTTGKKCNPIEVAEDMKRKKDVNGEHVFKVNQWLNPTQITSFFSRLASKDPQIHLLKTEIDDDDLFAALATIDEKNVIDNIE